MHSAVQRSMKAAGGWDAVTPGSLEAGVSKVGYQ